MNISKIIYSLPSFFRRQKLVQMLLFISPQSRIQKVEFKDGGSLWADISDPFPRTYFLKKSFDPEFCCIASFFLRKGGVYFDVGANFGFSTFSLLPYIPCDQTEFHLFEANPDLCQRLEESLKLHPRLQSNLNHGCVAASRGKSKLNVVKHQLGESFVGKEGVAVENIVLDDYIEAKEITKIDFMKMDIEGSEITGLQGLRRSIAKGIVQALYIEVNSETLKRFAATAEDCLSLLREMGFDLYFAKEYDYEKGAAKREDLRILKYADVSLHLTPIQVYPENHRTDIVAIHKRAGRFVLEETFK